MALPDFFEAKSQVTLIRRTVVSRRPPLRAHRCDVTAPIFFQRKSTRRGRFSLPVIAAGFTAGDNRRVRGRQIAVSDARAIGQQHTHQGQREKKKKKKRTTLTFQPQAERKKWPTGGDCGHTRHNDTGPCTTTRATTERRRRCGLAESSDGPTTRFTGKALQRRGRVFFAALLPRTLSPAAAAAVCRRTSERGSRGKHDGAATGREVETIIYAEEREAHSLNDAVPLTVRRRKETVASDKAIFDWREGRAHRGEMLRGDRRKKRERFLQTLPTAPPRRRRATDETRRHLLSATWLSSTRTSRVSDDEGPVSFETMACEKGRQSEDCERAVQSDSPRHYAGER